MNVLPRSGVTLRVTADFQGKSWLQLFGFSGFPLTM